VKLFGGPGEPNAVLGELGPRKNKEKTLLPSFLGVFCLLDRNTEWFLALHCNWHSTPLVD